MADTGIKIHGGVVFVSSDPEFFSFGVYTCHVCDKAFTINDAWGPCSPDTCHSCFERLTREPANDG